MERHRFHKSSFRPQFVMGAERKPMLFLLLVCVTLPVTSANLASILLAAALWLVLHPLLVWMGKVDPQLSAIYWRNRTYPGHIPAFTTPFRKAPGYVAPRTSWRGR